MSSLVEVSTIVGLVLPTLIAVVQQVHFGEAARAFVGVISCAVAAVVVSAAQTDFTSHTWIVSFVTLFISTMVSYEHFWKPSQIAPVIERATSYRKVGPA